jgi:hypothetical protein
VNRLPDDRAVERAAPLLRRIFPTAVEAELLAWDSEVEHLDQVIGSAGLDVVFPQVEGLFGRRWGSGGRRFESCQPDGRGGR